VTVPLTPEQKAAKAERRRAYRATPEGKAADAEYTRRYRATPKGKAKRAAHRATPEAKAAKAECNRRQRATPEGKAWQAAYAANPEGMAKRAAAKRAWRATPKGKALRAASDRRCKYGLTPADYDAMLAAQRGLCAVCSAVMDPPNVDHCHVTGQVRALLCVGCNTSAGILDDDPDRIHALADYIASHAPAGLRIVA
jgi:hypothetical protein